MTRPMHALASLCWLTDPDPAPGPDAGRVRAARHGGAAGRRDDLRLHGRSAGRRGDRRQGRQGRVPQGDWHGEHGARRAPAARLRVPPRLDHQAVHGRGGDAAGRGRQDRALRPDREVPPRLPDAGSRDHGGAPAHPHLRHPELHVDPRLVPEEDQDGPAAAGAHRRLQERADAVRPRRALRVQQLGVRDPRRGDREGRRRHLRARAHEAHLRAARHDQHVLRQQRADHQAPRPGLRARERRRPKRRSSSA